MVRKKEQYRMREMLSEAILVLCKASLEYRAEFSIEGLLGITLDNEEIFLINLNEHVKKDGSASQSSRKSVVSTSPPSSPRSHKRHRKRGKSPPGEKTTDSANESSAPANKHKRLESDQEDIVTVKDEVGSDHDFDDNEDNGTPHPAQRSDISASEASDAEVSRDASTHQQWAFGPSVASHGESGDAAFDLRQLQRMNAGRDTDNYGSHLSLSSEGALEGSMPGCSAWENPSQQQLAAIAIKEEHSQNAAALDWLLHLPIIPQKPVKMVTQGTQTEDIIPEDIEPPDGVLLPCTEMSELDYLEMVLTDDDAKRQLESYLASCGGFNPSDTTRRIMRRLMTNRLAMQLNWAGKGLKRSFAVLQLKNVVIHSAKLSESAEARAYPVSYGGANMDDEELEEGEVTHIMPGRKKQVNKPPLLPPPKRGILSQLPPVIPHLTNWQKGDDGVDNEGTAEQGESTKLYPSKPAPHVDPTLRTRTLSAERIQELLEIAVASGNPHTCPICGKTTTNTKAHIRTHTEERPFVCEVCKQAFKQSSHLRTHMVRHNQARKFKCTVCSVLFTLKGNLKKHLIVVHKIPQSEVKWNIHAEEVNTADLEEDLGPPDLESGSYPFLQKSIEYAQRFGVPGDLQGRNFPFGSPDNQSFGDQSFMDRSYDTGSQNAPLSPHSPHSSEEGHSYQSGSQDNQSQSGNHQNVMGRESDMQV